MSHPRLDKNKVKQYMKYNKSDFFNNPHVSFDSPPPNFRTGEQMGWTMLAKAIVATESGLNKYVSILLTLLKLYHFPNYFIVPLYHNL